jgi:hypothetical protein
MTGIIDLHGDLPTDLFEKRHRRGVLLRPAWSGIWRILTGR